MAKGRFEMSKKRGSLVSETVVEMARLVRNAAEPAVPGERVPHAIARAARRLGWARGRVSSFWYGKARRVAPEELERAREVALKRSRDVELLKAEQRRAFDLLARIEAGLTAVDSDFYQPEIDAARDALLGTGHISGADEG
jgi:hypothetical protein